MESNEEYGVEASHAGICILNVTGVVGLWCSILYSTNLLLSVGRGGKEGAERLKEEVQKIHFFYFSLMQPQQHANAAT